VNPATSMVQQVAHLKGHGLMISDGVAATAILQRISYYRLSGYFVDFKRPDNPYRPGTQWSSLYAIYEFDRRLRNLLLGRIEPIEISIRTKIAQYLAVTCDSLTYRDFTYFVDATDHCRQLAMIDAEIGRSRKPFADHYQTIEITSFGSASKMYSNLVCAHRPIPSPMHLRLSRPFPLTSYRDPGPSHLTAVALPRLTSIFHIHNLEAMTHVHAH